MIRSLILENFRKYKKLKLNFVSDYVVLFAPNAEGKTTILEALSTITNGQSSWTTEGDDLYNRSGEKTAPYFRISIETHQDDEDKTFDFYQDPVKKTFNIDKQKTSRKKFLTSLASTVFSPEQIELLMLSPDRRRDFLDALISKVDPEYIEFLQRLHKTLRHRNVYLKKMAKIFYETGSINTTDKQLIYWTDLFAEASARIMQKRAGFIDILRNGNFYLKYLPSVKLAPLEDLIGIEELKCLSHDQVHEKLRRDVAIGYTTVGAHRDDWKIFIKTKTPTKKSTKALEPALVVKDIKSFGSRGEKRMAVSRLIFRAQEIIAQSLGFYPTLLLDDITSELDTENIKNILSDSQLHKQQVFITTITIERFPKEILNKAQVIDLAKV